MSITIDQMNIDQMKLEVNEITAQIHELTTRRAELQQKIVDQTAKRAIGDRVKRQGLKGEWQITRIAAGYLHRPRYFGRLVTASGELGKAERELYDISTAELSEGL